MDFSRKTWILAASAVLIIAETGLFFGLRYYYDRKAPDFMKEYTLYVYPDTEAGAVLDSLAAGASARREGSLRRCARSIGLEEGLKPGKYEILPEHSAAYVMRMLVNGWQTPQNLTLSGTIRSKGRLAKTIGLQMMADSSEIAAALEDTVFLADYGFTPENVFALFLPDTYEFYWTASVKSIFDRFKKEYDRFWTPERIALADAQGLTPMEASVMASIVNGETLQKQEYPMIAGVYLNRLHRGMKLQADPTVCFCFDYTLDRVLKKHLAVDSPYNTYKYRGLPPAPINVPPKACIDAVLNPDEHGYLYFCASPEFDGTHRFAASYREHLRNAREFQRALTARQKERQASGQ